MKTYRIWISASETEDVIADEFMERGDGAIIFLLRHVEVARILPGGALMWEVIG